MYKQIRFQKIEFVSHDFKQVYIAACTVSRAQFLKISLDSQHTYNLVYRTLSIFSSRSCRQRQKIKNRSHYIWTIFNKGLTSHPLCITSCTKVCNKDQKPGFYLWEYSMQIQIISQCLTNSLFYRQKLTQYCFVPPFFSYENASNLNLSNVLRIQAHFCKLCPGYYTDHLLVISPMKVSSQIFPWHQHFVFIFYPF